MPNSPRHPRPVSGHARRTGLVSPPAVDRSRPRRDPSPTTSCPSSSPTTVRSRFRFRRSSPTSRQRCCAEHPEPRRQRGHRREDVSEDRVCGERHPDRPDQQHEPRFTPDGHIGLKHLRWHHEPPAPQGTYGFMIDGKTSGAVIKVFA